MKTPPPRSNTALLLIDVINDLDFPEGERLLSHALPAAKKLAGLRKRLRGEGVPVIYVNDNFGRWLSDFSSQIERCLGPDSAGREIAALLRPDPDDYFVLKPKHSGFYATSLPVLLEFLEVGTLILTGFAADICVLCTANDAYMRGYRIIMPSDCVASETAEQKVWVVKHVRERLKGRVCEAREISSTDPQG